MSGAVLTKVQDTVTPSLQKMISALTSGKDQLLTALGQEFARQTKANFGTTGKYRSGPWADYTKQYAKRKGASTPTLIVSGRLRDSIKVGVPSGNTITVSTDVPYSEVIAYGKIPRNYWPVLMSGKTPIGLVPTGDKDLAEALLRTLNRISNNAFPTTTYV